MTRGTLFTKKKTRTGRVFLLCGILAEHTQQGVKAALMITIEQTRLQQNTAGRRSGCGI